MIMRTDLYQGHDYYNMDELLTEEHKLIRDSARAWDAALQRPSAPAPLDVCRCHTQHSIR